MNAANNRSLNTIVSFAQNCFFNVPPYLETTECWSVEKVEKVIIPCAIEVPVFVFPKLE
jgi:hypothetical protein